MLTATYTLVSLSVEQASMRLSLLSFQKVMHVQWRHQRQLTSAQLRDVAASLGRLAHHSYWRKVDQYLIPVIRQAAPRCGPLLDELDSLNSAALASVAAVQQCAFAALDSSTQQIDALCAAVDVFCAAMTARLEKEERELFVLARKVIAGEAWFAIAHQLLAQDARARDQRRHGADTRAVVPGPGVLLPPRQQQDARLEKLIA